MFQNVLGSDGRMHLERQLGNQRIDLTTGDIKTVIPGVGGMNAVTKMTDNEGGNTAGTPSVTTDKIFLLSTTEVYGDLQSDGTQYEFYKSKGVTKSNYSGASSSYLHWTRSVLPSNSTLFRIVFSDGDWLNGSATTTLYVFPAFSF